MSNTNNHYFTVRVETQNDRRCAELDLLCAFASRFPDSSKFHLEGSGIKAKPDQQKVPLGPEDVKAGDEFLVGTYRHIWASIKNNNVYYGNGACYSFDELMQFGHKIRSIGETEWRPCYKEVEV